MGRYYYGDIEGKFWFAVQSSEAADRFGGEKRIAYDFDETDIKSVEEELKTIENHLGEYKQKLDEFFNSGNGYNDEILSNYLNVDEEKIRFLISEYADHELGSKILDCLKEKGRCTFEGEI